MTELRRSFAFSAAQSYIGVALQLVSTVVLSRVLTPTDVGVFAVATVFAALATNFRDFGIAEYLIQAKQLTTRNIRAAFAVNICMSWAMGLAMFVGAAYAGEFYRSEIMADVMRLQALNFLLIPFGAINQAWFRREMNFKPLFVGGVLSETTSLVVAITLAMRGHGPMSLAWASLAGIAMAVLVSMAYRPKDFPRWPGLQGVREVLQFGSFASGIYVLGQLGRGAPELIIGRVQAVADVAIFSRAGGLVQLFRQLVLRAVMPVCLPYFASSVREEQSVNRAYLRGVAIFTGIGWTFLGFLALEAFPAIRIMYGNQWLASVPLAHLLCIAGAIEMVHYLAKEALLAHGLVKPATRLQLVLQLVQVMGLAAVVPYGLVGACWGMLASVTVGLGLSQWHMQQGTGLRWSALWAVCRPSLQVTAVALVPAALLFVLVPASEDNFFRHILASGVLTVGSWLLALRWTQHPLWHELVRAAAPLARRLVVR